jgi:hypothetical protein
MPFLESRLQDLAGFRKSEELSAYNSYFLKAGFIKGPAFLVLVKTQHLA